MAYFGLRHTIGPLVRKKIRTVNGLDNVPSQPPFVVAANHVGFMDGPVLAMDLARRYHAPLHFLTDHVVLRLVGTWLARRWLGMIPVRKGHPSDSLIEAIHVLNAGGIIGIFPEGTRNTDPRSLLRGKTGAVRLALKTGAPLIPAGIHNTTGYSFKEALRSLPDSERFVEIQYGPPVDLSAFRDKPIDKPLLYSATAELMHAISRLCGKAYAF